MEIESVNLNLIFEKAAHIDSEGRVLTNQILLLVACLCSWLKNYLPTKPLFSSSPLSPPSPFTDKIFLRSGGKG